MSEAKMPQRYAIEPWSSDRVFYDPTDDGGWVDADDVEPLVAEINRLRAEIAALKARKD